MTEPTKYPWRDENGGCTNCGGHTGIQPECECFLTYARSEIAALTAQVEDLQLSVSLLRSSEVGYADQAEHWEGIARKWETRADEATAQVEALDAERRRDALDGQAALDEANNRIIELTKERDVLRTPLQSGQLTHGMNCPATVPNRESECTCGLVWRIALQTEQELHAAWEKRAYEAESALAAANAETDRLKKGLESLGNYQGKHEDEIIAALDRGAKAEARLKSGVECWIARTDEDDCFLYLVEPHWDEQYQEWDDQSTDGLDHWLFLGQMDIPGLGTPGAGKARIILEEEE